MKRFLLFAFLGAVCCQLHAQEIVHAVSGVVTAVNPAATTITMKTNDGSSGVFTYHKGTQPNILFDRDVRNGTTEPANFNKVGDHVIAYYVDQGFVNRTLIAVKDIGPSPLEVASGTVVKAKRHAIVLKTDAGTTETFEISHDASAETPAGVVSGYRYDPDQGSRLTVRYTESNGVKLAEFIRNSFG